MKKAGFSWLVEHYALKTRPLLHRSFIGTQMTRIERADGSVEEHYVKSYDPGDSPLDQLVFALKYDSMDLDILSKVFKKISPQEIADFAALSPSGRFARQIGFWYEELTGQEVPLRGTMTGNYVPLLDPKRYVTASKGEKNGRWRIENNLIGDRKFMPLIRRTESVNKYEAMNWKALIDQALQPYPEAMLHRVLSYLYFKETKSSFAIEREEAETSRAEKFVALLRRAGLEGEPLDEKTLTLLQNAIVDERYRENGFRSGQNFVGETTAYFHEIVHTVGVPPGLLRDLMEGLSSYYRASAEVHPVLRAAAISFPFVFIHPFDDGNGRLHRYLIHDILTRGKISGEGVFLPVSAEILIHIGLYDACLERFSKPLMAVAEYSFDSEKLLVVHNPSDIEGFYRYPDITPQCEFLGEMLEKTIVHSIPQEIEFLEKYDRARAALSEVVDMPDRKREVLLSCLHKNRGELGLKRREREFPELTDQEVRELEKAYQDAFENSPQKS